MKQASCGVDFGTSNSSIALAQGGQVRLVPVEQDSVTIPSAIFFLKKETLVGRAAVQRFLQREDGRFMRSLKRVLGTPLMNTGTLVNGRSMTFASIIGTFLAHLKARADAETGHPVEEVVMGRPVHFVDGNPAADAQAEKELRQIAESVGFRHISFQFEPIAAAFAHEQRISGEKLALVVDLGGGTSDFTVIRLSAANAAKADRSSDILANTGVRIGGNDFDKNLSLAEVMPELGYRSTYGDKRIEVPLRPFHDLSEWSKVNFLYTLKTISQTRQMWYQSHDKIRFGRLLKVLEQESGHVLLAATEDAKIALTEDESYPIPLNFLEEGLTIPAGRSHFEDAIREDVAQITASATACLLQAGVSAADIELVILTGGSTEVPLIQSEFRKLFPGAAIADENKLSSVGLGLAYDSHNKFGR
jgi:hypothetical chaperone protein